MRNPLRRGWRALRRLPTPVLWGLAAVGVVGVAVGGVYAYRTYDYIQHDNDFCLSCHLMADPYERFARSAHRGLGCKACHNPTLVNRSRMALTQILENPEALEEHAEVPNARCVACHVEGDPSKWKLISSSAGHRIHLESSDSSLQGLRCVQCHSSGVHEFTATDRTCGQAGCHDDVRVRLGKMGQLTIHCLACHDFSRPLPDTIGRVRLASALKPRASECLTCHAMRVLVGEIREDEPHGGVCGTCHNPHEQTTAHDAVQSCASAGCHERADTLTPMHRGLPTGALADCTTCHRPHDARIREPGCAACHTNPDAGPARRATVGGAAFAGFSHARHANVTCAHCHEDRERHGELTVRTVEDCQACHHGQAVAVVGCAACHAATELARARPAVEQRFAMSVDTVTRSLAFPHAEHTTLACDRCHAGGVAMSAARVDCASCHEPHHRPDATCRACHTEPAAAHDLSVHTGCAGSGCHTTLPLTKRPDTREFCLTCHQAQVEHMPGKRCVGCHAMPPGGDLDRPARRAS